MINQRFLQALCCIVCFLIVASFSHLQADEYWIYFGTYTGGESKGIYVAKFNSENGQISNLEVAAEIGNPSFLAVHPTRPLLYSANENGEFQGKKTGSIAAFQIDTATGKLTKLNEQSSEGSAPCHLIVDREGKNVLVANYVGGNAAVLPIQEDGSLKTASSIVQHTGESVNKQRQEGPHAHSINLDSSGKFAFVADLGIDKVMIYKFDSLTGTLTANEPAAVNLDAGSGPRHFAFHPNGKFAFVINELTSTLTAMSYEPEKGELKSLDSASTLPTNFMKGNSTADVHVHPTLDIVYGSNRGADSIAIFSFDQGTGKLKLIGNQPTMGATPRNFQIDPTGKYLLAENQDTSNVVVFQITKSGSLLKTNFNVKVPRPVCIQFVKKS